MGEDAFLPYDSVQGGDAYVTGDTPAETQPDAAGTLSTALTAPVNMTYNDASFKLEANSANNTVSATIVFDQSLYNGAPNDGIRYRYFIGNVDPAFAAEDTSAAFDGIKPIVLSTVSVVHKTPSLITLKWKGLANATSYSVYVKGKNLPSKLGMDNTGYVKTPSKTYLPSNTLTGGYKTINLVAASGHSFDGDYTFKISVVYDGHGTSKSVEKKVLNV